MEPVKGNKKEPRNLEAELDQLLGEIERRVPEAKAIAQPARDRVEPQAEAVEAIQTKAGPISQTDAELAAAIDALATAPPSPPGDGTSADPPPSPPAPVEPAQDLVGDALAQQIQDLLDEAKAAEAAKSQNAPAESPPTPDAAAQPMTQEAPAAVETPAPSTPPPDHDADAFVAPDQLLEETKPPADPPIAEIDSALAKGADEAIGGDFETIEDVLDNTAAPSPAAVSVAKELDSQGPSDPLASAATPTLDGKTGLPAEALSSAHLAEALAKPHTHEVRLSLPRLPRIPSRLILPLRHLLAVINQPFTGFSAGQRNLLGYLGLAQLVAGGVLVVVHALRP